jgi:hypothetical protein
MTFFTTRALQGLLRGQVSFLTGPCAAGSQGIFARTSRHLSYGHRSFYKGSCARTPFIKPLAQNNLRHLCPICSQGIFRRLWTGRGHKLYKGSAAGSQGITPVLQGISRLPLRATTAAPPTPYANPARIGYKGFTRAIAPQRIARPIGTGPSRALVTRALRHEPKQLHKG